MISPIVIDQTWNDLYFYLFQMSKTGNTFKDFKGSARLCRPLDPKMFFSFGTYVV